MYYNRKRQMLKSGFIITLILLLAVIATHHIYYKYKADYNIEDNSNSLDVIFHGQNTNKITIDRVTALTDSVGLSSKAYTFTIKNNLTENITYKIEVVDDKDTIKKDECGEYIIPKEDLRISLKKGNKDNKIYTLSNLENNSLTIDQLKALDEESYTIRVWVNQSTTLPRGSNMHYHGKIKITEKK